MRNSLPLKRFLSRKNVYWLLLLLAVSSKAQQSENLIVITTDGFRWQEVFTGMDSAIAKNSVYNQKDSARLFKQYWAADGNTRRQQLMPFLWSTVAANGQIYGNRYIGNTVNVSNPFRVSYPGYSEIFCGYVDTSIKNNGFHENPNTNVLEFFNRQPKLKGKVSVFASWETFNRILNEPRSGLPVVAAYDPCGGAHPTANQQLINTMLTNSHREWSEECMDIFTHTEAMEELKTKKPRVMYISYGETDEWAHAGKYSYYLAAASQVDKWIKEIWDYVQSDPQYKNKTTILITTDHGRGDLHKEKWTGHGASVEDADQIWFAIMGPGVAPAGEMKAPMQVYQKQFAQTVAKLMGYTFTAEHPVGEAIGSVMK